MILRLVIVGIVLAGLTALLVAVSPSAKESLLDYFEGVDAGDTAPVLLRYSFRTGQELEFESTAEVVSTFGFSGNTGGGILRMTAVPSFKVVSVDSEGTATMQVLIKKLVLESTAGFDQRRVEITPDSVRVFVRDLEVEPEPADIAVQKVIIRQFDIAVSSRGVVSFAGIPEDTDIQVAHLREFVATHFMELPEEKVAAGKEWATEVPLLDEIPLAEMPEIKSEFLGYKEYEGERCAVLRMGFTVNMLPPGGGGEEEGPDGMRQQGSVKFAGGLLFSMERGLPLIMFKRQEAARLKVSKDKRFMRGSSEEEYVIKLTSGTVPKK